MEEISDPNVPDRSNGDFFCKLCLATANSEQMWTSHIAGRRHIKNVMKFPNGMPKRNFEDEDSFDRPAKYGRYEDEAEWDHYPPKEYEEVCYPRSNDYVPEIRPQVIDYGHKKSLPEEVLPPATKIFDAISAKEKHEEVFADRRFDVMKQNSDAKSTRRQIDGILQSSNFKKSSNKETSYNDFEKELDQLLRNSSENLDLEQKNEIFSKDNFKKQINDLLLGKSGKRDVITKHKGETTLNNSHHRNYVSHKSSEEIKILDRSISKSKKTNGNDKKQNDGDLDKRYGKKVDNEDFVDIFHKVNDQKLFKMSDVDEPKNSTSSVKKSSKTDDSKLEDFDPDQLTPELLDDLLNSYLKPKSDSSKGKESAESLLKNSVENDDKEDDPDIIAKKLESLPTKSFFELILKRLVKMDLKDSDELKILLEVISQALRVVCKKLPPRLQAVIKAKMSQSDSKEVPVSVHNSALPQTSSVPTVLPVVTQPVSSSVVQITPQHVRYSVAKSISQPVTQSASHMMPQSVQSNVSYPVPQTVQSNVSYTVPQTTLAKSPMLNTSDSFQRLIAWQNYLSSIQPVSETTAKKLLLNPPNSIQAMIAYQNYLSNLQASTHVLSKTTAVNPVLVNNLSNSKTKLTSLQNATSSTQAVPTTTSIKPSLNATSSDKAMIALQKFLQTVALKAQSQTPSETSTKSEASCTLNSSQNNKSVSQSNEQIVTSNSTLQNSNSGSVQNHATVQNIQSSNFVNFYQQMQSMQLNRHR